MDHTLFINQPSIHKTQYKQRRIIEKKNIRYIKKDNSLFFSSILKDNMKKKFEQKSTFDQFSNKYNHILLYNYTLCHKNGIFFWLQYIPGNINDESQFITLCMTKLLSFPFPSTRQEGEVRKRRDKIKSEIIQQNIIDIILENDSKSKSIYVMNNTNYS